MGKYSVRNYFVALTILVGIIFQPGQFMAQTGVAVENEAKDLGVVVESEEGMEETRIDLGTAVDTTGPVALSGGLCHMGLMVVDLAPGDWSKEHMKRLYANSSRDLTYLYSIGKAYIIYQPSDGSSPNITGYFDRNSYWVQPQNINQWGIRTTWAYFNQKFVRGFWRIYYQC